MSHSIPTANRETLIKDMVERLVEEGVSAEEISAFSDYAQGQPFEQLHKDSLLFWTMRM